jgi:uncharacterized OB-fold protein
MATDKTGGWIDGEERIVYQHCGACGHLWYFRRGFCPHCGADAPQSKTASGCGTVCAMSLVYRAPSEQLREHVPYLVTLVDADEGFRLMAHGERSLSIGDRVRARFVEFDGRLIPFFEKS